MYSPFTLARKYLHYYFTAANGKGHGIHSPFIFDLVTTVLNDRGPYPAWAEVEGLRGRLLRDERILDIEDMGAGSVFGKGEPEGHGDGGKRVMVRRSVADIARRAAKPKRLGQLLFRLAQRYQPGSMLELGTSLGLSTAYLASGAPAARVVSIEGSGAVMGVAAENLRSLGLEVELINGSFDVVLDPVLKRLGRVDMAFVDGNHRQEPTLRYFHSLMEHATAPAVLIFDDIHWSAEMEAAWDAIRGDGRVYMTVDLFFIGIVFLRDEFKVKQEFTIRF